MAGVADNLASVGSISRSPEHSITDLAFWFAAASINFSFCLLLVLSFTLLLELAAEVSLSPSSGWSSGKPVNDILTLKYWLLWSTFIIHAVSFAKILFTTYVLLCITVAWAHS